MEIRGQRPRKPGGAAARTLASQASADSLGPGSTIRLNAWAAFEAQPTGRPAMTAPDAKTSG